MYCENCGCEHNGSYGSGRFCSIKCARSFSTKNKRKEINKKVSNSLKGFKTIPGGKVRVCAYGCGNKAKFQLPNGKWCCSSAYNKCERVRKKNSVGLKKAYRENKRTYTLNQEGWKKSFKRRMENLQEQYNSLPFLDKPYRERRRVILEEQEGKCLICGIQTWNGKSITFHLDHIDGNRKNNSRKNLRLICPNCHSQTDTYCRGHSKPVSNKRIIKALKKHNGVIEHALVSLNLVPGGTNWRRARKLLGGIDELV